MPHVVVFIEDKVRDETVRVRFDVDTPVEILIEWIVNHFGLPQRDFNLNQIEPRLMHALDGARLWDDMTLAQAGVTDGESLLFVSPEGRRVWQMVQMLLDEIEPELRDHLTGKLKDEVLDEDWERITRKLDEIEKTSTGGKRVEQVREWVSGIGGPAKLVGIAREIPDAGTRHRSPASKKGARVGKLLVAGLVVLVAVWALLVVLDGGNGQPPRIEERPQPSPVQPGGDDSDGDGLADAAEEALDSDPCNPDTDDDGLIDGQGYAKFGTDPLSPNTDGDGFADSEEVEMGPIHWIRDTLKSHLRFPG
jgi:hypothetical protein